MPSDYQLIKLSNSQRMRKNQVDSALRNRRNRPRAYYKCFSYLHIPRMVSKFGYGYETDHPLLRELRESFEGKCRQYFSGVRAGKLGRRDKHELKERLGFGMGGNPVVGMFGKLQARVVGPVLREAFENVREVIRK